MKKVIFFVTLTVLFFLTIPSFAATTFEFGIAKSKNNERPYPGSMINNILNDTNSYYIGKDNKDIYLTFDCGYENGYTSSILDTLKSTNTPATFFITGHYLKSRTELVKRMADEGHIVGNHTYHHYSFNKISNDKILEEVISLEEEYKKLTGYTMPKFVRPPMGHASDNSLKMLSKNGFINVFWSLAYVDWNKDKFNGKDYAYSNVLDRIHNGAIILMHAVSRDNSEALKDIICDLKMKGYNFKSLYEL